MLYDFILESMQIDDADDNFIESIDLDSKYFYHATFGTYLPNIKKQGLKAGVHRTWEDSDTKVICLSDDPDVAASYCEVADNVSDEVYDSGIFIIEIDSNKLDKNKLRLDQNNQADDTLEYSSDIPKECFNRIWEYE